jgi:hypothetical protein
MLKSILLIIFSCLSVSLSAQTVNNDLKIDIRASGSFEGTNLLISIHRHTDSIKIIYKLRDSVNYKGLFKNKRYNDLKKFSTWPLNVRTRIDSIQKINLELYNLSQQYTYYSKDSLLISIHSDTIYTKLLDEVSTTGSDSLENKKINKDRAVLDGTYFIFNIKIGNTERNVHAHSPDQISHPILYQLLHQTLEIYRRTKVNSFLSRGRTDYY